ncbi:acyl-CoA carboxylase subunit epsilon [bacterium]|nr:MAG: acyl-CoA carboxylase subunit epsilon [bacterium]
MIVSGHPTPEEAAVIVATLEAALSAPASTATAAATPPWRIAARLPELGVDALRGARTAWRLIRFH